MAKWARLLHQGSTMYGQLKEDMLHLYEGSPFEAHTPTGEVITAETANYLSPVVPLQFLGLWNNFHERRVADNLFMPQSPLFFVKLASSLSHHNAEIRRPPGYAGPVKFEAELGIVIGKPCFQVRTDEVDAHILGYTCVNDVTAPETLFEEPGFTHWCRAKSFPSFAPIGPFIETVVDPESLSIQAYINGNQKQNSPVSDMIFKPRDIVSMISQEVQLLPGDIIACGTSSGATVMQRGDQVDIVIDGIGILSNRYVG